MKIHLTIISLFATLVLLSGCQQDVEQIETKLPAKPVKIITVEEGFSAPIRTFPGKVAASESTNLGSKVGGQVIAINFSPGDAISRGDVLLEIDQTDYQLQYDQSKANFDLAQITFDRVRKSHELNITTQADFDNAKANLDLAQVGLMQSINQLKDTKIIAPYDGRVVRVTPKLHEFVSAAQPLLFIQSQENIDIKFQVPSDIVARINPEQAKQAVTVIFNVIPELEFSAYVKEFSAASDEATRSFDVTLSMPAPDAKLANLLPGMDASVVVDLKAMSTRSLVHIPANTVFSKNQKSHVWLYNEGRVSLNQINLGEISGTQIEVLSGLAAGDQIVAAGIHSLRDQQTVTVWSGK